MLSSCSSDPSAFHRCKGEALAQSLAQNEDTKEAVEELKEASKHRDFIHGHNEHGKQYHNHLMELHDLKHEDLHDG